MQRREIHRFIGPVGSGQHIKAQRALQAATSLAILVMKLQQGLRLRGIVGSDTQRPPHADNPIVLRGKLLQQVESLLPETVVVVSLSVLKKQRNPSIENQTVGKSLPYPLGAW